MNPPSVDRSRLLLLSIAVTVLFQGCTPADQTASPSGAQSPADSRSDAVPATALTGEIAFGASDGQLWLINAQTGARQQVTHGQGGVDFDPHWSPDGRQMVFRSTRFHVLDPQGTGLDGILIVNRDGSNERLISGDRGGLAATWSPDGRTIVYSTSFDQANERLAAYDVASGQTRDLGVYGEGVDWTPDGSSVLVGRLQGIVAALAGGQNGAQNWEIWRYRGDFTNPVRLTDNPSDDISGGWSADASQIVFTTKRRDAGDVWVMQADGTRPHPVIAWDGNQSAHGFLPDGRILFTDNLGPPEWYLFDPRSSRLERVALLSGIDEPVAWRGATSSDAFALTSSDLASGQWPVADTCDGGGQVPDLHWTAGPPGTRTYALQLFDVDAPNGGFTHWILANEPANLRQPTPNTGVSGTNDFGREGYAGPCPPRGNRHRYVFTVYAVAGSLPLRPLYSHADFQKALAGHVLSQAMLAATFAR